ncbi:hypothetical protein BROUX41_000044 [Berkeleyomyces rouxiae]|uniref:uncharacterized protein n=1 Tax=Berkeleyomyces rouxiae TaxID=2035830 RepID=UPI003B7E3725
MTSSPNRMSSLDDYGFNETFDIGQDAAPPPSNDIVGIDDEIEVTKKTRAPAVKLDEAKLLSQNGIPKLRRRAKKLRFRGKGHEWADASSLLSMYRLWLDDLHPKARFVDAMAMVNKVGRKQTMIKQRNTWLEEPDKSQSIFDTVEEIIGFEGSTDAAAPPAPAAPSVPSHGRRETSPPDDDLYNASPKRPQPHETTRTAVAAADDVPDFDDDLEAMMAEAESFDALATAQKPGPSLPSQEPDYSVEDELMAEMPFED